MGKLKLNIVLTVIFTLSGCSYLPRKTTVIDCIELTGELIAAYCFKPNQEANHGKTKEDDQKDNKEDVTKEFARARASKIDPAGILVNIGDRRPKL